MSEPTLSQWISLSDLAERLGLPRSAARGLLRGLLARERVTGAQILTRFGGTKRARYKISLSAIETHCPELIPVRTRIEAVASAVRGELEDLSERVSLLERKMQRIGRV